MPLAQILPTRLKIEAVMNRNAGVTDRSDQISGTNPREHTLAANRPVKANLSPIWLASVLWFSHQVNKVWNPVGSQ